MMILSARLGNRGVPEPEDVFVFSRAVEAAGPFPMCCREEKGESGGESGDRREALFRWMFAEVVNVWGPSLYTSR